ncbi:MAG: 2-succinyl-5-enolpyruvyl-6-hydroxy-3-cyclohexene-1-carboxylic-acid synthase [Bacteroidetes bacterium]|nr:2-succinyl-5-enolpyruvyl-6-hydroxy-3-cyclohexene-1-carboxylic-acid synthase [Bacteroidota bacterium]
MNFHNLRNFIQLLFNAGCRTAFTSPGSRNAPVLKALYDLEFEVYSDVDERSSAFKALGFSKATGYPVILNCTSGTAGLNYYPAIAEAFYSRVPLIILTADRPANRIDQWDGQAIRQTNVFANHTRLSETLNLGSSTNEENELCALIIEVINTFPGPVHINIPLTEPLYDFEISSLKEKYFGSNFIKPETRTIGISDLENHLPVSSDSKILFFEGSQGMDGISFSSDHHPVFTDVSAAHHGNCVGWDTLLHSSISNIQDLEKLRPDFLITTGTTTVSKGLKIFLSRFKPQQHIHISPFKDIGDMFGTNPEVIHPDAINKSDRALQPVNSEYLELWHTTINTSKQKFENLDWKLFTEFAAIRKIMDAIPENAILHVSNSMPIRYCSILGNRNVNCNRATSGIDGCTSTAIGIALAQKDKQHFLISGDLAFLYDINALWNPIPLNVKITVINNSGGGIFRMIDGPEKMQNASGLQVTPHNRNLESLAAHFNLPYFCATDHNSLNNNLSDWLHTRGPALLEVRTDMELNESFFKTFKKI